MEQYIKVADHNIKIVTANETYFKKGFQEYINIENNSVDFALSTYNACQIRIPDGKKVYQGSRFFYLKGEKGENIRCYYGKGEAGSAPCCLITDSQNHKKIEIQMTPACAKIMQMTAQQWEYICQSDAFCRYFTRAGGLVLHGSGVCFQKSGILFSADSGVGKSTHAALWKQYYPLDTVILNDDKPAFTFEADGIWMHGTPWSGKTDVNHNGKALLSAIVMIERGDINQISRISTGQAFSELVSQICTPRYHTDLMRMAITRLQQLLGQVPVYRLSCTIDRKAAEVVRRELFERGV